MQQQVIVGSPQPSVNSQDFADCNLVVELAGPAGSGKTTLRKLLCMEAAFVHADLPPSRQSLVQLPQTAAVLMAAFLPPRKGRSFTWAEIRSMLYLRAWLRAAPVTGVSLFDQGPAFRLAILREFGPPVVATRTCEKWLHDVLTAWSRALHFVVWLDAPNQILVDRIRARSTQQHACKTLGDDDAFLLLDRYRSAHQAVLFEMQAAGNTRVLRFSSAELTTDEIGLAVRDELRRVIDE